MDRGAWQATVHGVAKSRTRLSDHTHTQFYDFEPGRLADVRWILALACQPQVRREPHEASQRLAFPTGITGVVVCLLASAKSLSTR